MKWEKNLIVNSFSQRYKFIAGKLYGGCLELTFICPKFMNSMIKTKSCVINYNICLTYFKTFVRQNSLNLSRLNLWRNLGRPRILLCPPRRAIRSDCHLLKGNMYLLIFGLRGVHHAVKRIQIWLNFTKNTNQRDSRYSRYHLIKQKMHGWKRLKMTD